MTHQFSPEGGLVVVEAEVQGPLATALVSLALDTGATRTLPNASIMAALGYDPALSPGRVEVTTGSGVEFVPSVTAGRVACLGKVRDSFAVLCHTLPPSTGVDGLLGLDFLSGSVLTLDFVKGMVALM